jgi:hypothetical protein
MSNAIRAPVSTAPVWIHPGFVKTATSTLQRHVFARHPELHFLGLPAPAPALEWAVRHICQADTSHFEAERLRQVLAEALAACPVGRRPLISYENLALYESKDKGLVAERLAALFPAARILFTIRRQEDLVTSWYLTKLRVRIKRKAFIPFEEWYWVEAREPWQSILDDLRFSRTIALYERHFGRAQVAVLPFEALRHDPAAFAAAAAAVLEIDAAPFAALMAGKRENASMSQRYLDFWKRFNQVLPRRLVRKWARRMPMHDGPPARIAIPDDIRTHLRELIAADNAALARDYGLDLARWGYALPASELSGG